MTTTNKKFHVAVVGATGAVGQTMISTLIERNFPIGKLTLLSSKRSAGKEVEVNGEMITVKEATPESFEGVDIALFSAGGSVSKELAPEAVKRGAIVVDNTSAFRMTENVPLVVPEVNPEDLDTHEGIIANPNCSTIQMVVALEPIRKQYGLKKVIVSTYQAVSGSGAKAIQELEKQTKAYFDEGEIKAEVYPHQIAFNAIPQIDVFQDNGFTYEEMKMINETKKIMHMPGLEVAATCVRIPVQNSHSESVYIEIENEEVSVSELQQLMKTAEGITLQDDPAQLEYPMPFPAAGKKDVFVGRIRKDLDRKNGFHLWIVSDNLLKGAAWNSVQIAETLVKRGLLN
ncbi:aspartate-semialdehyde dehydrogenase [Lottiidibacillus patelloidae]|uniref:Aspartate-semialdehyde dehydrogenase n=1 Tax=Lottiidibacillus patelloidae TaxID=2670334 RepID=A0A263BY28_9BACI|nr:aspartate-semialdehyde dehydrogenase [Lottiidibacillus patelloidae]OZM58625.1 aspartate-semialdehyde dehydrogenase [Lottiidibacillus patelloidae]